ncbi:MAG: histidine phosphatase family protein [Actinobacteria bacterium]|nr:histidine phosphatase family protein [Actinomycetota bacterium]
MRTLYLLRHAKSSWDDPTLADHDRPLAARGIRATSAVADHLRHARVFPDVVLCSAARRTRETLDLLGDAIPATSDVSTWRTDWMARLWRCCSTGSARCRQRGPSDGRGGCSSMHPGNRLDARQPDRDEVGRARVWGAWAHDHPAVSTLTDQILRTA